MYWFSFPPPAPRTVSLITPDLGRTERATPEKRRRIKRVEGKIEATAVPRTPIIPRRTPEPRSPPCTRSGSGRRWVRATPAAGRRRTTPPDRPAGLARSRGRLGSCNIRLLRRRAPSTPSRPSRASGPRGRSPIAPRPRTSDARPGR